MRFLVDAMLGKLAKWLRILGHDTLLISPELRDDEILEMDPDGRVFLTRDKELLKRMVKRGVASLEVPERQEEALALLSLELGLRLRIDPKTTRCPFCNSPMFRINKKDLDNLPKEVIKGNNIFLKCYKCGNVYWFATHYWQMLNMLLRARSIKVKMDLGQLYKANDDWRRLRT